MEQQTDNSAFLEDILQKEISILTDLYACQKRMYECVLARDWVELQKETARSENFAVIFLDMDEQRIETARKIKPEAEGSRDFYSVTAELPEDDRTRINAMFREVKRLLLLSKTENEVFNTYVTNARSVINGMLETVMPSRRNKTYNRRGDLLTAHVESLLLNRSF
ncbi:hypothetical protein K7I13_15075 [Brucepastera parasyntrophica]|uniref:flagellar export chaperone FlgN n=1 Tax=Brucepastera parasyntrophica TaxID=2880008 RepID=UPI00210BC260|nr:flagellar export chaperone FlgN [Brucepastera parasyntrophica]ULQ59750.1 hypothetical protein K7I13_15075 [Brucepastera parasyntrophica]